jgi:hypothetical protein
MPPRRDRPHCAPQLDDRIELCSASPMESITFKSQFQHSYTQMVANWLGVPEDKIRLAQADTPTRSRSAAAPTPHAACSASPTCRCPPPPSASGARSMSTQGGDGRPASSGTAHIFRARPPRPAPTSARRNSSPLITRPRAAMICARQHQLGASRELPHCARPVLYMISSLYLAVLDGVNVDRHDLEAFPRSGNSEESS